ncbi:DMT family transporter [Mesorhizobium sp. CN2-181]|uniref:DMT family transporter n=1 Tax=Mesorhizobium yinganensis TaxID=3157707 RepID=UPI0032B7A898
MTTYHPDHRKGLLLTAIGGLTLSFDVPLVRLASGDQWTVLLLRSSATLAVALLVWLLWRWLRGDAPRLVPGRHGIAVALLYGLSSVAFVAGVFHTSTANLVFILAFAPMFAALLGWLFRGERPSRATLAAMALMVLGVLIIVGDSIGTGNLFGDLMALASALMIASAITITRISGDDMGFTALVAVVVPLALAVVMTGKTGFQADAPWWIVFNGAVIMPVAFFCLATGPKYLSGPEVAMFYLLETVLAPIWVWMIFSETPTRNSLIGGAILIAALLAHSLWQLTNSRRRSAAEELRHPA